MTLYDYIALNNPQDANQLLNNYGFEKSGSVETISERLKAIVRKYKKIALQDISFIHPDKQLLNSFTKSTAPETEFAYATGRTPGFVEPMQVPADNFVEPKVEPKKAELDETKKILDEIKAVKKQSMRDRERRFASMGNMQMNQNNVLILAVVFAIGYMIGNK